MATTVTNETQCDISTNIERHDSFYFENDPMAIFLVENRLFRVHRHYLINGSPVFRDMFSVPTQEGTNPEGTSDERPIRLPDVTLKEFQTLMEFFYSTPLPKLARKCDAERVTLIGVTGLGLEEKLALLSISHRFLFENLFKYVLQEVKPDDVPVADRIYLGDKYGLSEWLSSAYESLLDRTSDSLSLEEANALGMERVVCLFGAKCFMYRERSEIAQKKIKRVKTAPLEAEAPETQVETWETWGRVQGFGGTGKTKLPAVATPEPATTSTKKVVEMYFKISK